MNNLDFINALACGLAFTGVVAFVLFSVVRGATRFIRDMRNEAGPVGISMLIGFMLVWGLFFAAGR